MQAGDLDRRITIQRASMSLDSYGAQAEASWSTHAIVWANKADISDGERFGAAQVQSTATSRFTVRYSATLEGVTAQDRILYGGVVYQILHTKEAARYGRQRFIEITTARSDGLPNG